MVENSWCWAGHKTPRGVTSGLAVDIPSDIVLYTVCTPSDLSKVLVTIFGLIGEEHGVEIMFGRSKKER